MHQHAARDTIPTTDGQLKWLDHQLNCRTLLPRSLSNLRGCRRQLVTLYREAKAGLIDPPLLGRLVHCLNSLQAIDNGRVLEDRIAALEARLANDQPPRRPNGSSATYHARS